MEQDTCIHTVCKPEKTTFSEEGNLYPFVFFFLFFFFFFFSSFRQSLNFASALPSQVCLLRERITVDGTQIVNRTDTTIESHTHPCTAIL